MAIVFAQSDQVFMQDIYGNPLLNFTVPEPVRMIKGSRSSKDSFIAVMADQHLYVYEI